jgi:hypothetical protein
MSRCPKPVALARGDEAALEHADTCEDCQTALARVRMAEDTFGLIRDMPAPETSDSRAEATLRWTRPHLALASTRRLGFAFAGLALAGAAVTLFVVMRTHWSKKAVAPVVVEKVTPPTPIVVPQPTMKAVVTLLGGEVELSDRRPLGTETLLGEGDALKAARNGFVAAQWAEGSGFLLRGTAQTDAALTLSELKPRAQRLDLARGRVDVRVGGHSLVPVAAVATPGHLIRVRGTWFAVWASGLTTTVEVYEGTVEVSDRSGGTTTLLSAPSRGVFIASGHALPAKSRVTTLAARDAVAARAHSELNILPVAPADAARAFADQLFAGSGVLAVDVDGAAQVAIDGVELGTAPLGLRKDVGRHLVEVSRHGYLPLRRWVTIGPTPGSIREPLIKAPIEAPPSEPPALSAIEAVVKERRQHIRACYERSLKRDPQLAGTVTLQLKLDAHGRVANSSIDGSTLGNEDVSTCLRREAAGWVFADGRNATIVYPFVFRPQ